MTDTTNVNPSADEGDSPEYLAKMHSLADGETPPADPASPEGDQTPAGGDTSGDSGDELILGKFKSTDDLAKAYKELEAKLGSKSGDGSGDSTPSDVTLDEGSDDDAGDGSSDDDAGDDSSDDDAGDDEAPLDFEKYTRSFAENGGLTDDDYAELESKGFPRSMVDVYVKGLESMVSERTSAAAEAVGGEDKLAEVQKWANENLSDSERRAVNRQLQDASSAEEVGLIYETLNARYRKANPTEPAPVDGNGTTSAIGYSSRQELADAMNDPRYGTDPAYRKEVERKVAATAWLG